MMKLLFLFLICVVPFSAWADINPTGSYDGVIIGYNAATHRISGYQNTASGNGQFSCIFYFSGQIDNNKAAVKSYFPGDLGTANLDVITGNISFSGSSLRLELQDEPGGCWNLMPYDSKKEDGSVVYDLTRDDSVKAGNWQSIGVVKNKRAYFYDAPDAREHRKTFVIKGDGLGILQIKGEWVEVEYPSGDKPTKGWIKSTDLYKLDQ